MPTPDKIGLSWKGKKLQANNKKHVVGQQALLGSNDLKYQGNHL